MRRTVTELQLHPSPQPSNMPPLAAPLTALQVTGIFNPFGPTLEAIAAVGPLEIGNRLPVARMLLNPFVYEVEEVGTLLVGAAWRPSTLLRQLYELRGEACPSLILPLRRLRRAGAVSVYAEYLRGIDDARYLYESLRRYPHDPWQRASAELRDAIRSTGATNAPPERLDAAEARDLAATLLSHAHRSTEFRAFFAAWRGSIVNCGERDAAVMNESWAWSLLTRMRRSIRMPLKR